MSEVIVLTKPERAVEQFGRTTTLATADVQEPEVSRDITISHSDGSLAGITPTVGAAWWHVAVNALGTFVIVITGSLACLAFLPMFLGYRPTVVTSGSMDPALQASDVVLIDDVDGVLPVGAVIDYASDVGSRIHRVVAVTDDGYVTKGDANAQSDTAVVEQSQINGIGVMVVPFVGQPRVWLEQGRWLHLIVLVLALGFAGWVSPQQWLYQRRIGRTRRLVDL